MTPVDVLILCLAATLAGWGLTLAALWRATRPRPAARRPQQRRRREHQVPAHKPLDRTEPMPVTPMPGPSHTLPVQHRDVRYAPGVVR